MSTNLLLHLLAAAATLAGALKQCGFFVFFADVAGKIDDDSDLINDFHDEVDVDFSEDKVVGTEYIQAAAKVLSSHPLSDLEDGISSHTDDSIPVDAVDDRAAQVRVKLDAVHGMLRLDETLLKSHGAYAVRILQPLHQCDLTMCVLTEYQRSILQIFS